MLKAAVYARFSSKRQNEHSIRDQIRNCEAWAQREGVEIIKIYRDEGISGARNDRPNYMKMIDDAIAHRFSILLLDDFSRLSRDLTEALYITRLLDFHGIRVIGVSDGIDSNRKDSKILTHLKAVIAEVYLEDLKEQTLRGQTGQVLAGYFVGSVPYGYMTVRDDKGVKLVPNFEEAEIVREIFSLYVDGKSPRKIAEILNQRGIPGPRGNQWSSTTIYPDRRRGIGILANSIYKGEYTWRRSEWLRDPYVGRRKRRELPSKDWIVRHHPELQIISNELWDTALHRKTRKLSKNGKPGRPTSPKYLYSGILECGICNGNFVMISKDRYGCSRNKNSGQTACTNRASVTIKKLDKNLLPEIFKLISSDELIRETEKAIRNKLSNSEQQLELIAREIQKDAAELDQLITDLIEKNDNKPTKSEILTLESNIEENQRRLQEAESPDILIRRLRKEWTTKLARLEKALDSDVPTARTLLLDLVGKIILLPENGELIAILRPQPPEILGSPISRLSWRVPLEQKVR